MLAIRKPLPPGEKTLIRDAKPAKKIPDSINILCLFMESANTPTGSLSKHCEIPYAPIIIPIIFVDTLHALKYGFWKGIYTYCENQKNVTIESKSNFD